MSESNEGNVPLPQGPWGLPGMGESHGGDQTHVPADKKKQHNRSREKQAKKSRKINRGK
jgi:hypothetical protein